MKFLAFTFVLILVMKAVAQSPASAGILSPHEREAIDAMAPQQQAERLVERSVSRYSGAMEELRRRLPEWFGKIESKGTLSTLLLAAENSSDLEVREAAMDVYLAAFSLEKTEATAERLRLELVEDKAKSRPWNVWALAVLGGRGIGADAALRVLEGLRHDSDDGVRNWVAAGFSLLGRDEGIPFMVEMFGQDASKGVRERAGCGLAESGLFRKEQRRLAIPGLLNLIADGAADPTARKWYYQALREITGKDFGESPAEWQSWWASYK